MLHVGGAVCTTKKLAKVSNAGMQSASLRAVTISATGRQDGMRPSKVTKYALISFAVVAHPNVEMPARSFIGASEGSDVAAEGWSEHIPCLNSAMLRTLSSSPLVSQWLRRRGRDVVVVEKLIFSAAASMAASRTSRQEKQAVTPCVLASRRCPWAKMPGGKMVLLWCLKFAVVKPDSP
jgi:hypothetical protein